MRTLLILVAILALAAPALAQMPFVEDFEGGSNDAQWTWAYNDDVVEATGGNPGGFLHNTQAWGGYPVLVPGWDMPNWSGDLAAAGATRISGDFICYYAGNPYLNSFYTTVVFRYSNGTPGDVYDDVYVYPDPTLNFSPGQGEGWKHYSWDLPFDFVGAPGELPPGWVGGSYLTYPTEFPTDITFQEVISNVSRIEFWFHGPEYAAVFAQFDMGADNIILEVGNPAVSATESSIGKIKSLYR